MQLAPAPLRSQRLAKSPLSRALLALAALVLMLQLFGSSVHKHDLSDVAPDCVSCYIATHLPTGVPPVNVILQAIALGLAYRIARQPQYLYMAVQDGYLTPPSQAPPRHLRPV